MKSSETLRFAINEEMIEVSLVKGAMPLVNFLRGEIHLRGSKVVCAEGDCGACAVLVDRSGTGRYSVVNSCILPLMLVEGSHIVTIEGLNKKFPSHPMKEKLFKALGSQCGFCTPGFMMTLSQCYEQSLRQKVKPTVQTLKTVCSGHLCRCTGYKAICEGAMEAIREGSFQESLKDAFSAIRSKIFAERPRDYFYHDRRRVLAVPQTLRRACQWKARWPQIKVVGGGTDLGVVANKTEDFSPSWLCLKNIKLLQGVRRKKDGTLRIMANATLSQVRRASKATHPEFAQFLKTFASPNVRHIGTLVGNLVTASPIGDSLPYLVLIGAKVQLVSEDGWRELPMEQFILGYRKTALKDHEIVASVVLPPKPSHSLISLKKVSKREHMDISTLSMAASARLEKNKIAALAVAFGGMAGTVTRLPELEQKWIGRNPKDIQREEVDLSGFYQPMSDHRGSRQYRLAVAENLLAQFLRGLGEEESFQ